MLISSQKHIMIKLLYLVLYQINDSTEQLAAFGLNMMQDSCSIMMKQFIDHMQLYVYIPGKPFASKCIRSD